MKKRVLIFLVLSLAGFVGSIAILNLDLQASSTGDLLVRLGKSLFYGMLALAVVFLVLLFIPRAFEAWKKFAKWFVPIAALIFIFYPEPGSGDYFSPYPEQVFKWVSVLYVLISFLVIFKARKSPSTV